MLLLTVASIFYVMLIILFLNHADEINQLKEQAYIIYIPLFIAFTFASYVLCQFIVDLFLKRQFIIYEAESTSFIVKHSNSKGSWLFYDTKNSNRENFIIVSDEELMLPKKDLEDLLHNRAKFTIK